MNLFLKVYKRNLAFLSRYKKVVLLAWLFGFLLLLVNNLSILIIGELVDSVSRGDDFIPYIFIIAGTISAPLIVEPLTMYFRSELYAVLVRDYVNRAYNKILNLDYNFHTKRQTGKLVSMVIGSEDAAFTFIWQIEWSIVESLMSLIIPIAVIALIDIRIALALVACLILSIPFIRLGLKENMKRRVKVKDVGYERNTQIVDGISNYETVKIFGREQDETSFMSQILGRHFAAIKSYQNSFRLIDAISRISGVITFAVTMYVVVALFRAQEISLGTIVVVITYLLQVIGKIYNLFFTLRDVVKNLPVIQDLFDLIDHPVEINELATPLSIKNPTGKIEINKISFAYEENKRVINNLSISIKPKENVAFVGPSGGGKSTLVKLLMRYYDVSKGSIEIDGIDIKNLKLSQLRSLIGLVPQEPVLFNKSLLYNIGYAISTDPEVIKKHKKQIIEACKKAQIHKFIETLPEGYDTMVGERGIKLSGGQRQRIAIARVILKAPQIVIFDEATSMLDSESELAIQKAFKEMSRDKTVIIIAHRLSTIIHCDKIFVIEEGKVKESGSHRSLQKKRGLYAKLWDIQSGGFVGE